MSFGAPFLRIILICVSSGQQVSSTLSSKFPDSSSCKNVRFAFNLHGYILTGVLSAFAPYLLEKKAIMMRKTMDLEKGPYKSVRTVFETNDRS